MNKKTLNQFKLLITRNNLLIKLFIYLTCLRKLAIVFQTFQLKFKLQLLSLEDTFTGLYKYYINLNPQQ